MSGTKLAEAIELNAVRADNCMLIERGGVVRRAKIALLGDSDTLRDIVVKIFNDIKDLL